ncbi:MAG: EamA family transporter [Clostridiaceae bacterium]|nr:EamA family transporter [Clostridiaceae bacterium]
MKTVVNERTKSIVFLVITATMWSLGGLLIKSVDTNPMAIAGVRSGISAVIILAATGKPKLNWSFAQIGAALSYTGLVLLFVAATKNTTAANAILIQYTAPVYVALLSAWFLKEKVKLLDWLTIGIVMGGMILFFVDELSMAGVFGNLLAAGSGICFAFFTVFMRMQKEGSPIESVLLGNIITALIGIPFIFTDIPGTAGWINLVVLGVIQLGLPYILYSMAIKHVTALEASLIPVIEPMLNPVWVWLFIGEVPGLWALVGGVIVMAAVTIRCVVPLRNKTAVIKSDIKA